MVWALAEEPRINSFAELKKRMEAYCAGDVKLDSLEVSVGGRQVSGDFVNEAEDVSGAFFQTTLPCIVRRALQLPSLQSRLPGGKLETLRQGTRAQV